MQLRPYQEKSLGKMFGNGRARSGLIVLPCGAGKSLVGVAAAARMRKGCLCLCTSSVSVDQWRHQFLQWTNLQPHQVTRFTSDSREEMPPLGVANVTITTFTMISHGGKRSEHGEAIMDAIKAREWGLLLLDEVHVVPAQMFRKVIGIVKVGCCWLLVVGCCVLGGVLLLFFGGGSFGGVFGWVCQGKPPKTPQSTTKKLPTNNTSLTHTKQNTTKQRRTASSA